MAVAPAQGARPAAVDVSLAASVPEGAPGAIVDYTLRLVNRGAAHLADVVLTDDLRCLLKGASYVGPVGEAPGKVRLRGGRLTWRVALAPGAVTTLTYGVRVRRAESRWLTQTASVTGADSGCPPRTRPGPQCSLITPVQLPPAPAAASAPVPAPMPTASPSRLQVVDQRPVIAATPVASARPTRRAALASGRDDSGDPMLLLLAAVTVCAAGASAVAIRLANGRELRLLRPWKARRG